MQHLQHITALALLLENLGIKGLGDDLSDHELDAVTGALTALWLLDGKGEVLGGDDGIIMPLVT